MKRIPQLLFSSVGFDIFICVLLFDESLEHLCRSVVFYLMFKDAHSSEQRKYHRKFLSYFMY